MKFEIKRFILPLLALAAAGCAGLEPEVPDPETDGMLEVPVTVEVPGNRPITRSMDGSHEAEIGSVNVLVFQPSGSGEILSQHVTVPAARITQSGSSTDKYQAKFLVTLTPDAAASTVIVVANAAASVTGAATAGVGKAAFLQALTVSSTGKWSAGDAVYTRVPMYGEQTVTGITSAAAITGLSLTRMLARIDIENRAAAFALEDIYLMNYNTGGYVCPAFDPSDGKLLPALPVSPMVPSTAGRHDGSQATAWKYSYPSDGSPLEGEIYLFEAERADGGETDPSRSQAVCLIVKGTYDGREYFYRIDFTDYRDGAGKVPGEAGFDPSTVSYIPVYRNHCYRFDISEVSGPGFATFDEAYASLSVTSNLKCALHIVDTEVDYTVFNGQHYLGVETNRHSYVLWKDENTKDFVVKTNYPGGWTATIKDTDRTWLTFENRATVFSGTVDDKLLPIVFYPKRVASPEETITVTVTAGRLSVDVVMVKECITTLFAKGNIIGRDGRLTFATSPTENAQMPADYQGLQFKFGSLLGLNVNAGAVKTAFDLSQIVFRPSEYSGSPADWFDIPYCQDSIISLEWAQDMLKFVYPASGYDAARGKGDICRYITDRGWVEGKWRLPTIGEIDLLLSTTNQTQTQGVWEYQAVNNYPSGTYGTAQMINGWWIGSGPTETKTVPGEYSLFFPASGIRYPSNATTYSTGMLYEQGINTWYWSASCQSHQSGGLVVRDTRVSSFGAGRDYGLNVRCIRDWQNE